MLIIGSHVSFSKEGLLGSAREALSYGANTFMIYTGAPQNTRRSPIDAKQTENAYELMKKSNMISDKIIAHAPYLINLANNIDPIKYNFSCSFLRLEMDRCISLGIKYLVLHPGSAVKHTKEEAITNIVNGLNKIISPADDVTILLETMAGKGTEIGSTTTELKMIIDQIILKDKIGLCIDTCHLNDSGVDLTQFDEYLNNFDDLIGIDKIKCVHVNDSKNIIGEKKIAMKISAMGQLDFQH